MKCPICHNTGVCESCGRDANDAKGQAPRVPTPLTKRLMLSGRGYVGATAAVRDAKRLLYLGFSEAAGPHRKILTVDIDMLFFEEALEICIAKEATDLLDLYERCPRDYPQGRDAESALAHARKLCKSRYVKGKCRLCKGPALSCLRRHANGRSCA